MVMGKMITSIGGDVKSVRMGCSYLFVGGWVRRKLTCRSIREHNSVTRYLQHVQGNLQCVRGSNRSGIGFLSTSAVGYDPFRSFWQPR